MRRHRSGLGERGGLAEEQTDPPASGPLSIGDRGAATNVSPKGQGDCRAAGIGLELSDQAPADWEACRACWRAAPSPYDRACRVGDHHRTADPLGAPARALRGPEERLHSAIILACRTRSLTNTLAVGTGNYFCAPGWMNNSVRVAKSLARKNHA
jgi:hypothetical protein